MTKKYTGTEKLEIVLAHVPLLRGAVKFSNVAALRKHYGVSGEDLRLWRLKLYQRAEEIYADMRFFHAARALEEENQRLKLENIALKKQMQLEYDEFEVD